MSARMIAIGCATTDERAFRASGKRTIETLDEGSSLLLRHHRRETVADPYNEMLTAAAAREELEAIVFVHEDAVVFDRTHIVNRIRSLLAASPEVAVVGAVEGGQPREVATVMGTLLVLSAWAVRNLRFDPAMGRSIDAAAQDISLQARAKSQRVLAAPLGVSRAWHSESIADRRAPLNAMVQLWSKWQRSC